VTVRVVIPKAELKRHRACNAAYTSPEWDVKEQALVYSDFWLTTVRLLSTTEGTEQLEWLVNHKLVPMTKEEFVAKKAERGGG
jgi:hypothetical protein